MQNTGNDLSNMRSIDRLYLSTFAGIPQISAELIFTFQLSSCWHKAENLAWDMKTNLDLPKSHSQIPTDCLPKALWPRIFACYPSRHQSNPQFRNELQTYPTEWEVRKIIGFFKYVPFFGVVDMLVPRRVGRGIPSYLVCCFFFATTFKHPMCIWQERRGFFWQKKVGHSNLSKLHVLHQRKAWQKAMDIQILSDANRFSCLVEYHLGQWREIILRSKTTYLLSATRPI